MFAESPLNHVMDTNVIHFFEGMAIHLPWPLTKYMLLTVLAAVLVYIVYVPLAMHVQKGDPPRGKWWNAFESMLTFLRDEVARPCIGHGADEHLPFLWSVFLFILFCNLLGMIPFMGSPTASISVTLGLAIVTFFYIHGYASKKMGGWHYLKTYVPHLDVPFAPLRWFVVGLIFILEVFGNFIKAGVLAIRLFANMFAGHMVLAVILMFIVMARYSSPALFWGVTFSSVLGVVALSLLELFVAFLQAYVFTFLTALFIGMALHPQH